jgi:ribonucleotide reductase alpha subunit
MNQKLYDKMTDKLSAKFLDSVLDFRIFMKNNSTMSDMELISTLQWELASIIERSK